MSICALIRGQHESMRGDEEHHNDDADHDEDDVDDKNVHFFVASHRLVKIYICNQLCAVEKEVTTAVVTAFHFSGLYNICSACVNTKKQSTMQIYSSLWQLVAAR